MFDYLEKLRQRPISARKRFALYASGCITAVFALVWVMTLPITYSAKEETNDEPNPWQGIKNTGAVFIKTIQENYRELMVPDSATSTPAFEK